MHLSSLKGCRLAIGAYPPFSYDATGGGGEATLLPTKKANILHLFFASDSFSIPPLTSKTTRFLYLPLPIGFKIKMYMEKLEGTVDKKTGEICLWFSSRFVFSIVSRFSFPPLSIQTTLTTGEVKSSLHKEKGHVLQPDGKATLVGVAIIPKTGNKVLDIFLGLPNEALAVLQCKLQ